MRIPEKGMSPQEILKKLETFKATDLDPASGRMFGHAFQASDVATDLVERAYNLYLHENALDPTLFPSLLEMETDVVAMAASHLNGGPETVGNFTSGGTESILLGVLAARNKARAERPHVTRPEMVLPVTAHAAFHKAAHYFGLTVVPVPVNMTTFKAEAAEIEKAVTDNTVLIVASAVSYAHGVVDRIPDIAALAEKRGIPMHVDGCIGGFLLPYFRRLGEKFEDFDLSVPGVTSISMDFHKYAFAAKGASVVLYKSGELRKHAVFACSDWTGYTLINPTVQSSRSGGPLAATWAVLHHLGDDGYLEATRKLRDASRRIMDGVNRIEGLHVLGEPEFCIFGVGAEGADVFYIVDEMKARGWHVQAQFGLGPYKENFHLTVLPVNVSRIDEFLSDLSTATDAARGKGPSETALAIARMAEGEDGIELGPEDLDNLFKALGIEGDDMPERMADINHILNLVPPALADKLFVAYYNKVARKKE